MTRTDRIALLAIVLPAVAGTLTLGPLALHVARSAPHVPPPACLAAPLTTPMIVQPAAPRTPHPSPGRVEASNVGTRDLWQGRFAGPVVLRPEGVVVSTQRADVHLLPGAPRGMLRGLRVDLAEPTPDGSWRIAREGMPVAVGARLRPGGTRALAPMDLLLPGVGAADLRGRWIVLTMLVDTPNGHAPLAHAHVPWHRSVALAERAARMAAEHGRLEDGVELRTRGRIPLHRHPGDRGYEDARRR